MRVKREMKKGFLIGIYFMSPCCREYMYSGHLPMTPVISRSRSITESCHDITHYLYKIVINAEVDINEKLEFPVVIDSPHGVIIPMVSCVDCDIDMRHNNQSDSKGNVIMCGHYGDYSCLVRFKNPLAVEDNV